MFSNCRKVYQENLIGSSGFHETFTTDEISLKLRCESREGMACIHKDALPNLAQLLNMAFRHT
jgi:hypothetical protein